MSFCAKISFLLSQKALSSNHLERLNLILVHKFFSSYNVNLCSNVVVQFSIFVHANSQPLAHVPGGATELSARRLLFIRVSTLGSLFNGWFVCFILIEPRSCCMSGMVFDDFTTGQSRKA